MSRLGVRTKIVFGIIVFTFSLFTRTNSYCQVVKKWETQPLFMAPESVVFDSIRNCLYVGNYNDEGGFTRKAVTLKNECVSKLDLEGNIQEFRWIDSLHNPTGITIYNDKLYIVEREGLAIVKIEKQKIEKRIPVDNAVFLNDIVVDSDGVVYITDTFKPCVHRIKDGKSEVWYSDSLMESSNGLIIDGNCLLVGNSGIENFLSISITDKKTKIIANGISENIDGIKKYNNGFLISWQSELYSLELGNKKLLYKLDNNNDFLADFEFIKEKNLVVIPLLLSNKVIALYLED